MPLAVTGAAILLGLLFAVLFIGVVRRLVRRRNRELAGELAAHLRLPALFFSPSVFLVATIPLSGFPDTASSWILNAGEVLLIATGSWLVMRFFSLIEGLVVARYPVQIEDNLKARKVHTQIRYIRRVASFLVGFVGLGAILLMFDGIRQLGTTLLTTAGVAGIVIGFAAQKTLGMVIAGLQVAFTQPVRLGDAVIVENEWGWIEEITLTYVVVKVWDWRRLVVPINYFLDNVIQNWTRSSSRLIGTVYLSVDYGFPVDELRPELNRILEKTELWDGMVSVVQVVDVTEKALSIRVLVTARDSPTLWDLRCLVRERLIGFIGIHFPSYLPRLRVRIGEESHSPHRRDSYSDDRDNETNGPIAQS